MPKVVRKRYTKTGRLIETLDTGARRVWNPEGTRFRKQKKENGEWKTKKKVDVSRREIVKPYSTGGMGFDPRAISGTYSERVRAWTKPSGHRVERIVSRHRLPGETEIFSTKILKNVFAPGEGRKLRGRRFIKRGDKWQEYGYYPPR